MNDPEIKETALYMDPDWEKERLGLDSANIFWQ